MNIKISRSDPFWRELFFEAWKMEVARAIATRDELLMQGPRMAQLCAGLADDALREVLNEAPAHAPCGGKGCQECNFSGREPVVVMTTSSTDRSPEPIDVPPCGACDGTGKKGRMGDDGNVTRTDEPCPICQGTAVYMGTLRRAHTATGTTETR